MVMEVSFASGGAADRLGDGRLKACPSRASAAHCRGRWLMQPTFLSGKLLLAMPGMADPRFERAVIAICVHDENGAIGIGVGHKRAGITFADCSGSSTSIPARRPTAPSTTAVRSSRAAASSSIRPIGAGRTRSTSTAPTARFSR